LIFELNQSVEFTAEAARVSRTLLPSGVRILTEEIPGAPSVALAASVGVGSRDEADDHLGSTHFLEHLLFKGTAQRNAREISVAFDSVGGSANAATAKEYTSYYARVQNAATELALDVILDMFTGAKLDPIDFETERTVILEELAMSEDDPEDVAHETMSDDLMPGTSLGRPIGGTKQSILDASRDRVYEHYLENYHSGSLIVTASGGVKHSEIVDLVQRQLDRAGWTKPAEPKSRRPQEPMSLPKPNPFRYVEKDVQQANVLFGFQSLHSQDPRRFALGIMNTILGGGMSSRLYQEIREERGLAYSTYAFQHGYSDAGFFGMYAGCNPENAELVARLMLEQLDSIAQSGVSEHEFELAMGNITGSLALRFESILARMNRLLGAELGSGEYLGVGEVLEKFRAVQIEEITEVAQHIANSPRTLVAVGKQLGSLESLA